MGINVHKLLACSKPRFRLVATNQDTVGFKQIVNRRTFSKELGIREHLEMESLVVRIQNTFHCSRSANRKRRLFDDDLPFVCNFQNVASRLFPVLQVGSLSSSMPKSFCRSVHRYKNNVRFLDRRRNIRTKKQITATCALNNIIQTRFKNRKVFAIPGINTRLVNIDNSNLDIRALVGNNGHCRPADIACTNAHNFSFQTHDHKR